MNKFICMVVFFAASILFAEESHERIKAAQGYVKAAQNLGFHKVTIIDRSTYKTLACTYSRKIADCARTYKDVNNKSINENQELLDIHYIVSPKKNQESKKHFWFYGKQHKVIYTGNNPYFVGMKGAKEVICVCQFNSLWFIASARLVNKKGSLGKLGVSNAKFNSAESALTKIDQEIWSSLLEQEM
ncbi:hypothetical protein [Candidatus Uabimicrobium sp. HlEnr_7]|uniref:hypothetical protein n=1 Tax=Candidatus Uabimicrobium helgolandensis TaxID=3095367 RepID=UPI003558E5FD